ncbi:MAG: DUF1385 domain-containing protein [Actinomycetota bacterium]
MAVRRPDGNIHTEVHDVDARRRLARSPLARGIAALFQSVSIGLRALRVAVRETTGVEPTAGQIRTTLIPIGIGVLALFVVAPGIFAAGEIDRTADVLEASARAAVLLIYLLAVSRSAGARRLFEYHGAEHKVIAAFEERGTQATVEDARQRSPIHPRCGTSFIVLFVIVAGVVHAFAPRTPLWANAAWRIGLTPVDAAIAYEVMRATARSERSLVARVLSWPGRLLQRLTTREPAPEQLDVARTALGAVLRG